MKDSAVTETPERIERAFFSDLSELSKARLTFLVLLTTLAGFYAGLRTPLNRLLLVNTLLGTAMVAAAASALNQYIERAPDAKMRRTENRPLAAGRLPAGDVARAAWACGIVGTVWLGFGVNWLSAGLAALTLLIYICVYTPLKQLTPLNTLVGAVPGAIPPLIGWAAARGRLDAPSLSLFVILFVWQIPHFLAIAWLFRDEYAAAGFKMAPLHDPSGMRTARTALLWAILLIPGSLLPYWFKLASISYAVGAIILGLVFAVFAARFYCAPTNPRARALFLASIAYLPLVLGLLAWAKIF